MNPSTKCSQQTSPKTTWKEPPSTSMSKSNDGKESLELIRRECTWWERWDNEHLAYADIDLRY